MKNIALIIAGGVGARMGQDIPKQFINVHDKPVIIYTLEAFQKHRFQCHYHPLKQLEMAYTILWKDIKMMMM